MATNKSTASSSSTGSDTIRSVIAASHAGHKMTRVGSVSVQDPTNPGTFEVWYCQNDHVLLIDSKS